MSLGAAFFESTERLATYKQKGTNKTSVPLLFQRAVLPAGPLAFGFGGAGVCSCRLGPSSSRFRSTEEARVPQFNRTIKFLAFRPL